VLFLCSVEHKKIYLNPVIICLFVCLFVYLVIYVQTMKVNMVQCRFGPYYNICMKTTTTVLIFCLHSTDER